MLMLMLRQTAILITSFVLSEYIVLTVITELLLVSPDLPTDIIPIHPSSSPF